MVNGFDILVVPHSARGLQQQLHPHVLNVLAMQMTSHLHMQISHVPYITICAGPTSYYRTDCPQYIVACWIEFLVLHVYFVDSLVYSVY